MKKNILTFSVASLLASHSLAWSWPEAGMKGDDPKPLVDVIEVGKKIATGASNGVRDVVGAVGNATGITNIIDSNQKVIADIGTIQACMATLCYSEVVKKKQLEEAEQDAKEELKRKVAESERFYNRLRQETRINTLNDNLATSAKILHILNQHYGLLKGQGTINAAVLKAINTQITWSEAMAREGVKTLPALQRNNLSTVANALADKINRDTDGAMKDLNNSLQQLETSANRSRAELITDLIYHLDQGMLRTVADIINRQQQKLAKEMTEVEVRIAEQKAYHQFAQAKLAEEKR